MIKDKKPLIIGGALVGVLLIAGGGFFFWQRRKSVVVPKEESPPRVGIPEPLVEQPSAEEITYETFETTNGEFSFDYPATWLSTDLGKNLETILPKNFIDKYELDMPLFLTDPQGAQISLSVYLFDKSADLNAVMDALKADLVGMGSPYDEVRRQTVGEALVVDSTVDAAGLPMQVRDVLFLAPGEAGEPKNTVYNLGFSAPQSVFGEYEPIFDQIQSSATLSR